MSLSGNNPEKVAQVVLERWGVRHIYDHSGTVEDFGHALAGERVDARVWLRRHNLVTELKKLADEL